METPGLAFNNRVSYSTKEALAVLYEEIGQELEKLKAEAGGIKWRQQFSFLYHKNVNSAFHWTSGVLIAFLAVCLLVSYCFSRGSNTEHGWLVFESLLLLLFIIVNVYWSIWHGCLENQEFFQLAQESLHKLENCLRFNSWNISNFPHIHSPLSPCVSLQWTIRDQELVNVPHALLVKGDIILLRPGQQVPALCRELEESDVIDDIVLNQGDIYKPKIETDTDSAPQQKCPLEPKKFVLLETPYIKNLRCMLDDKFQRPASIIDHERYAIVSVWLERRLVPMIFVLMLVTNTVRYIYQKGQVGYWTEMFLTLQVQSVLPILPLLFPLIWKLLDIYGHSRVFAVFQVTKESKVVPEGSFSSDSSLSVDEAREDLQWKEIWQWYKGIFWGRSPVVCRKINLVHVLGSVTSLCCVDKKGILSWPNPSAEKIFVLTTNQKDTLLRVQPNTGDESEHETLQETAAKTNYIDSKKKSDRGKFQNAVFGSKCKVEVLDLSHDTKSAFGLHFDDTLWKKHISSLKPLGLNILANTCYMDTVGWYTQFTDHVACAALENEETVAVVNRRCLCELAKQIGFSNQALDIFSLNKILGLYRQVPAEAAAKERMQRARSFVNHRIPMPNMVSVVVQEKNSGICQLMSQGTADVLLDCCSDFWSGEDLCVLTESHRRKILDFYHRTSMASYCTAFSYRPMTQHFSPQLNKMYIELPDDCSSILHRQGANTRGDDDTNISVDQPPVFSARAFSLDSLFDTTSIASIEDASGCFQAQSNQIFIGMVTMQYQARQEFVQLIEKLEGACIRFVHFSQENEVRSRVFSEKMGLEAGWNCHISLLSRECSKTNISISRPDSVIQGELSHHTSHYSALGRDSNLFPVKPKQGQPIISQQRSFSAPSIVNLDASQVKFEVKVTRSDFGLGCSIIEPVVDVDDFLMKLDKKDCTSDIVPMPSDLVTEQTIGQNGCNAPDDWLVDASDDIVNEESHRTSSYITENTDSLTDIDNRAHLPQGIENIRPHLKNVDNVPLLVNLFTDCTTDTSQEMMKIMQEYGEVVLCIGSSVNIYNTALFMQADCSLAIEPLYPQVCAKQPVMLDPWDEDQPTPMQIASSLLTVLCPLSFKKQDHVGLIKLIAEARNHLMSVKNCFYLMLCYVLSVSLIQVLATLFLLPPVLASQHLLWLIFVVIPLLSLTLMGNPVDPSMMSLATNKNKNHLTKQMMLQFSLYFCLRFVPSIAVALLCHGMILYSFCLDITQLSNNTNCALYSFNSTVDTEHQWYDKFSGGLVLSQNISHFLLVFYFIVISASYVHWSDHIWQKPPFRKKLWFVTVVSLLCCQIFHFTCDVLVRNSYLLLPFPLSQVHIAVWVLGLVWPVVLVLINELVKRQELKLSIRYQKRARLNFGTKLGMNSPFG